MQSITGASKVVFSETEISSKQMAEAEEKLNKEIKRTKKILKDFKRFHN